MITTWILVANASTARLYVNHGAKKGMQLVKELFHPESRSKASNLVADRPGHDRRYAIDITKINRQLGWQPRQNLGTGLHHTIQWYLSHPEWVAAIRQQHEYQKWVERNYSQRTEKPQ